MTRSVGLVLVSWWFCSAVRMHYVTCQTALDYLSALLGVPDYEFTIFELHLSANRSVSGLTCEVIVLTIVRLVGHWVCVRESVSSK